MAGLPVVSGREAIRALERAGFRRLRQSGSHVVLQKPLPVSSLTVVVPVHPELARGTLRSIIRKSGLSVEEFAALI